MTTILNIDNAGISDEDFLSSLLVSWGMIRSFVISFVLVLIFSSRVTKRILVVFSSYFLGYDLIRSFVVSFVLVYDTIFSSRVTTKRIGVRFDTIFRYLFLSNWEMVVSVLVLNWTTSRLFLDCLLRCFRSFTFPWFRFVFLGFL